jgi:hypothetical protein
MAACARGGEPACRRTRTAPSAAAGELIPAAKPERSDATPRAARGVDEPEAPARQPWLKSLSAYDRRHSSEVHGARYG